MSISGRTVFSVAFLMSSLLAGCATPTNNEPPAPPPSPANLPGPPETVTGQQDGTENTEGDGRAELPEPTSWPPRSTLLVGDSWNMTTNGSVNGYAATHVMEITPAGNSSIVRFETDRYHVTAAGFFKGLETKWVRWPDLAVIRTTFVGYDGTTTNTTFERPCGAMWPLAVGMTWSQTCRGTSVTAGHENEFQTDVNYTVTEFREEAAPGGTLAGFVVNVTTPGGTRTDFVTQNACPGLLWSETPGTRTGVAQLKCLAAP